MTSVTQMLLNDLRELIIKIQEHGQIVSLSDIQKTGDVQKQECVVSALFFNAILRDHFGLPSGND